MLPQFEDFGERTAVANGGPYSGYYLSSHETKGVGVYEDLSDAALWDFSNRTLKCLSFDST